MCIMSIYTYTNLYKKRKPSFYLFCSANIPRLKPWAFPPYIVVRRGKNEEAKSNSDASNNSTILSKTLTIFKNPYIKICITTPKLCQKDLPDIATMIPRATLVCIKPAKADKRRRSRSVGYGRGLYQRVKCFGFNFARGSESPPVHCT